MPKYVVDTNLHVEAITTDGGNAALAAFQRRFAPFLFQHSTVAQEILAGARDEAGYRAYHEDWVAPFEALGRILTPSHTTWTRAALIIVRLVARAKMSSGGLSRSVSERLRHCRVGPRAWFVLVTRNATDFGLIRQVEPRLQYALPWPGQ